MSLGMMIKLSKIEINLKNRRYTEQSARLSVAHPATKCMFFITMFNADMGGWGGGGGGGSFEVEKPSLNRDRRRLTYTARQTKHVSPQCGITKKHTPNCIRYIYCTVYTVEFFKIYIQNVLLKILRVDPGPATKIFGVLI